MPRVEFEPTIPVFEQAKAVHALDSAATAFGQIVNIAFHKFKAAINKCLRVMLKHQAIETYRAREGKVFHWF
jgi:hypothetical protein